MSRRQAEGVRKAVRRKRIRWAAEMLALALVGGVATWLSLPHMGAWFAAPIGLGVLVIWLSLCYQRDHPQGRQRDHSQGQQDHQPSRQRLSYVYARIYAYWLGAYGFGLIWITDLTVPGWLIAALIEALIMTVPMTVAMRFAFRASLRPIGTSTSAVVPPAALVVLPTFLVIVPASLVIGEAIRWTVPFGGVPLSNLAIAAANSPLTPLARLGGPLLVIAAMGLLAVAFAALALKLASLRPTPPGLGTPAITTRYWAVPLALVLLFSFAGVFAPQGTAVAEIKVAVLQSGGELGERGRTDDVFDRHVDVTRAHASQLASQSAGVELLVWSESSLASDGPLEDSPELRRLEALATEIDTTIVANFYERTVGEDPPRFRNATVIVAPESATESTVESGIEDGEVTSGYLGRYDKVHLVPFGEYIPWRDFLDNFADLSLVSRDAIAGTSPGVLPSPFGKLAVVSSFEIYFQGSVRSGVKEGGQIVVNPTLASTYRTDWVPAQSLASAQLRAVESGRWVLQSSTTGYSAVIDPAGNVVGRTELGRSEIVVATAELREGQTLATSLSSWPIVAAALAALVMAVAYERQRSVTARPQRRG